MRDQDATHGEQSTPRRRSMTRTAALTRRADVKRGPLLEHAAQVLHCPRCGNGFLHRYRSTADIIMMWREGCSAFVELLFANDRVVLDAEVRYERALGRRS